MFFENSVLMFDVRTRCVLAELTHGGKIFTVCCLDGLHTSPERERNREASPTHQYWEYGISTQATDLTTQLLSICAFM